MHWIDIARGLCGVAVVVHHAVALCGAAGYTDGVTAVVDDAVSPFRMPLLMSLSGAVVVRGLDRPFSEFAVRRLRTIAWPYVVWSLVVLLVTGSFVPGALLRIPTVAPTYLWFLQFLAVYAVIGWVTRRIGVPPLLLAGVALGASAFLPETHRADRFAYLLAFFLLGVALRTTVLASLGVRWRSRVRIAGAVAASAGMVAGALGADVRYDALWSPAAIGLVIVLFASEGRLDHTPEGRLDRAPEGRLDHAPAVHRTRPRGRPGGSGRTSAALQTLGRHAVVLYVTHLAVITLALRAVVALDAGRHLPAPAVIVVSVATAGAVAVALITLRRHRSFDALFVMPTFRFPVPAPTIARAATRRT